MHTHKLIATGFLVFIGNALHAQTDKKTEPALPKTTISNTKVKPIVPGGEYKHPDHIQPLMDPAMDVKESSPVLPDPGKIEPMKVPEQNQTVPLYPENSKVGQAAKTAGIPEKKQP